jgi:outer membrane protein OmpA-like peptidoglycan-associated protein
VAKVVVRIRWKTEVVETAPVYATGNVAYPRHAPSTTHLLALLTFFTGLLLAVSLRNSLDVFQKDLHRRSVLALYAQGIENPDIRFNGLDATVTGMQGSGAVSELAKRTLLAVPGVRNVSMRILDPGSYPSSTVQPAQTVVPEVAETLAVLKTEEFRFATGATGLSAGADLELDLVAEAMKRQRETRLEIQGHTDSVGDPGQNMILSQQRAEAVRTALIAKGVAPNQLFATGLGATRPRADNSSPEGRQKNRRIEIRLHGAE